MDEKARKAKNKTIGESMKKTLLRHASMRPLTIELKLDLKCLNRSELNRIYLFFVECRWLCNYLLSLDSEAFRSFGTEERNITSLDKDGNTVERSLTMPAKFIQAVYTSLKKDMKTLAAKREKTGKKNGRLRFRSSYDSIELNQYGNTHWILYGSEGDKNGRYKNRACSRDQEANPGLWNGPDSTGCRIRQCQAREKTVRHISHAYMLHPKAQRKWK